MPTSARRVLPALAVLVALALPTTFANGTPRVDAAAAPFADGATTMGVDLAWDDGLVLVLAAAGVGALGDALVPIVDVDGLPRDALGRVVPSEATVRSGVIASTPNGTSFVLSGTDARATGASFAARLEELGFTVAAGPDGRVLTFDREGSRYRATFGSRDDGVQVYVGAL